MYTMTCRCCWLSICTYHWGILIQRGDSNTKLAVSELDSPSLHVYDVRSGSDEPMESFQLHRAPVMVMRYNAAHDTVISIDQKGAKAP